jgi:hypothetical protein
MKQPVINMNDAPAAPAMPEPPDCGYVKPDGVAHLDLGSRWALYSETSRSLFELNETADLIWQGLIAGQTPSQVARALATIGASAETARSFVDQALSDWLRHGHLTPEPVANALAGQPAARRAINIDGVPISVLFHLESDPTEFDTVFSHFVTKAGEPGPAISQATFRRWVFHFIRRGCLGGVSRQEALPVIKALVTDAYLAGLARGFVTHAAVLAAQSKAIMISGEPGAGKTTLASALAGSGYEYQGDDIARIYPDGAVAGVHFAMAVKRGAWSLVEPYSPGLDALPSYWRSDNQQVRYVRPRTSLEVTPLPLGYIFLLARRDAVTAHVTPLTPLDAVTSLLESSFANNGQASAAEVDALACSVRKAQSYRLTYASLAEALRVIDRICRA